MENPLSRHSGLGRALLGALTVAALAGSTAGAAFAQPYGGDHPGWGPDRGGEYHYRRGERMGYNDWSGAPVVDYRQHHLRRPRDGYEWREHNGRYVMVAVATGIIASILLHPR